MNLLQQPLLEFLGLDDYLDLSTGRFIRLPSRSTSSDESKVNRQLTLIEGRNGQYVYLENRIKERVSCIILEHIIRGTRVVLSSIKNDILHHTDAILLSGESVFAIDYTTDATQLDKKMKNTDSGGDILLIGPNGQSLKKPFLVAMICGSLIDTILIGIHDDLVASVSLEIIHDNIGLRIDEFYSKDKLPKHIVALYMDSRSVLSRDFFTRLERSHTVVYTGTYNNPPPLR